MRLQCHNGELYRIIQIDLTANNEELFYYGRTICSVEKGMHLFGIFHVSLDVLLCQSQLGSALLSNLLTGLRQKIPLI